MYTLSLSYKLCGFRSSKVFELVFTVYTEFQTSKMLWEKVYFYHLGTSAGRRYEKGAQSCCCQEERGILNQVTGKTSTTDLLRSGAKATGCTLTALTTLSHRTLPAIHMALIWQHYPKAYVGDQDSGAKPHTVNSQYFTSHRHAMALRANHRIAVLPLEI